MLTRFFEHLMTRNSRVEGNCYGVSQQAPNEFGRDALELVGSLGISEATVWR
jgi:hypothetical protein